MSSKLVPRAGAYLDLNAVVIPTARLLLRPVRREDLRVVFHEFTDAITRYMCPETPRRMAETEAFIESALEKLAGGQDLQLVITTKETGEFIGCCGLHSRAEPLRPELGVWVKLSAHGKAFGREAVHGLKQWADKRICYEYLIYPVDRANTASRRIPESLGGEICCERIVERPGRPALDEVVYHIAGPTTVRAG